MIAMFLIYSLIHFKSPQIQETEIGKPLTLTTFVLTIINFCYNMYMEYSILCKMLISP